MVTTGEPYGAGEERLRRVLRQLESLRQAHRALEHEVITLVNELGISWDRIGEAHDPPISRQAAKKRYSHPKPRRQR